MDSSRGAGRRARFYGALEEGVHYVNGSAGVEACLADDGVGEAGRRLAHALLHPDAVPRGSGLREWPGGD